VVRGFGSVWSCWDANRDQNVYESQAYQITLRDKPHMRGFQFSPCHPDTNYDAISDTRVNYLYIIGKNKTFDVIDHLSEDHPGDKYHRDMRHNFPLHCCGTYLSDFFI